MVETPDIRGQFACPHCLSPLVLERLRPHAGLNCRTAAADGLCTWMHNASLFTPDRDRCPIQGCFGGPPLVTPPDCSLEIDRSALPWIRNVAILALDRSESADMSVATLAALLRLPSGGRAAPASWHDVADWSPDQLRLGWGIRRKRGPLCLRVKQRRMEIRLHMPGLGDPDCRAAAACSPVSRALSAHDLILAVNADACLEPGAPAPARQWLAKLKGNLQPTGNLPRLWLLLLNTDSWQHHAGSPSPIAAAMMEGVIRRALDADDALDALLALPWADIRFVTASRPLDGEDAKQVAALLAPLGERPGMDAGTRKGRG